MGYPSEPVGVSRSLLRVECILCVLAVLFLRQTAQNFKIIQIKVLERELSAEQSKRKTELAEKRELQLKLKAEQDKVSDVVRK